MGIFSEELRMLDRNTAEYMIDEMQNEITQHKEMLKKAKDELGETHKELEEKDKELEEKDKELKEKNDKIKENRITLITQIRNLASAGFSAEKCANMLAADISTVNKAYEAIKKYPENSDAKILELLEP